MQVISIRWLVMTSLVVSAIFSTYAQAATKPVVGTVIYVDGRSTVQKNLSKMKSLLVGQSNTLLLGEPKYLRFGNKIYLHDVLKTSGKGVLRISLNDGSKIRLRPNSSVHIKQYDQDAAQIEVIKGGIRATTGKIARKNPSSFKVITPRGIVSAQDKSSDFSIRICKQDCDDENKQMAWPQLKTNAPVIAKVVAIKGIVQAGRKHIRRLKIGNPVYSAEHLVSSKNSYAQLQFKDGSSVSLQAESSFDITDYKYNVTGFENKSIFKLIAGGLRFVSGLITRTDRTAFRLNTPVVTMGVRGTDFMVNCIGHCSSGVVVAHVIKGSINQTNKGGTYVVEAGSYSIVKNAHSAPVLSKEAPVSFSNNIAPPPSKAHVNTRNLFITSTGPVKPGTYVSVNNGRVKVIAAVGAPATVAVNKSALINPAGKIASVGELSSFQTLDPVKTAPEGTSSSAEATRRAAAAPARKTRADPGRGKNTIVIGVPTGGSNSDATAGTSAVTTTVIQEQTIAGPYSY